MKILAISNAYALAHVSRLLEIAKVLRRRGHQILFASHGLYRDIPRQDGFATRELPYMPAEQIWQAARTGQLWKMYPKRQLDAFIEAELALYREYQPDLVLIDSRATARTSAELAGLPTATVTNVHMSNHRHIPFASIQQRAGRNTRVTRWIDSVENSIEMLLYDRAVMGGLNALRRQWGMRPLFSYEHEEGDVTMLADIPELNPVQSLPAHVQLVGPLTWHNGLPPPACLSRLDPSRPTIYLSLGSASLGDGNPDERRTLFAALTQTGAQVVVAAGAAGNEDAAQLPDGVFLESFVNTDHLLPHCNLVCCHGGNGTLYQALRYGLPVVVAPTHAEQHYGGKRIEQLGLGQTLRVGELQRRGLRGLANVLRDVLTTPRYRDNARRFTPAVRRWNSAELAADLVERRMLASPAQLRRSA